jgi:hypothetical protein
MLRKYKYFKKRHKKINKLIYPFVHFSNAEQTAVFAPPLPRNNKNISRLLLNNFLKDLIKSQLFGVLKK